MSSSLVFSLPSSSEVFLLGYNKFLLGDLLVHFVNFLCVLFHRHFSLEIRDGLLGKVGPVLDDGEQIESNLRCSVFLNSFLNLGSSILDPVLIGACSVADGTLLKTIKLVKHVFMRNVADEVEDIIRASTRDATILNGEGVLSSEGVMDFSDQARVADGLSFHPIGHTDREILELL